jgi:hypothetical protein
MNRVIRTVTLGTAATLALVGGACAPAFASTSAPTSKTAPAAPRTLASIQASAQTQTANRITSLNKVIAAITAAKDVTSSDRSTILGVLNADVAGMNTVEAKVAADTTVGTAAADYKTIFTTYRVYAVAIPQAHLAAAADRLTTTTIPHLTAAHTKLAAALAGKDASKSTPALLADLADMTAQLTAASSAVGSDAATVLAVTPADYNGNHSVITSVRTSVAAGIADVKKAATDAKTVLAAIK